MKTLKLLLLISLGILVLSCFPKKLGETEEARQSGYFLQFFRVVTVPKTMERIAREVVLPGYEELNTRFTELETLCEVYNSNPSVALLESIREEWRKSYLAFKKVEWAYIGPAFIPQNIYLFIEGFTKSLPINPSLIEANINDGKLPSGVRSNGLDAMEYLLFQGDTNTVHSQMNLQPFRRIYLRELARNLKKNSEDLRKGWDPNNPDSYFYTFVRPGLGNQELPNNREALNQFTNQLVFLANTIIDLKLGEPSGLRAISFGNVNLGKVENPYAKVSLDSILSNLDGYSVILQGGFGEFLESRNPGLASRYQSQLHASRTSVLNLKNKYENLKTAILLAPDEVESCLNEMKRLRIFLSTDLVGSLGGTVGVSTNDGD